MRKKLTKLKEAYIHINTLKRELNHSIEIITNLETTVDKLKKQLATAKSKIKKLEDVNETV